MALVPLSYNVRSLLVRRSATVLTVVSIGATVAVVAGVLALQQGFATLFSDSGRDDVVVFLRKGAQSEGESIFPRDRIDVIKKSLPELATDADGPLAAAEMYLAVRLKKVSGGETNVPIRGVEPASVKIRGDGFKIEGRMLTQGSDEVIVGRKLSQRIRNCGLGDVIQLNTTPMKVVGIFDTAGPFGSEMWGDVERLQKALQRPVYSRVVATLKPGTDVAAFKEKMANHTEVPSKVLTEREYLTSQTKALSGVLIGLGVFLALIMGTAAVFTGTNTMLAALAARSHEIGILLAIGFRPFSIFLSFLFEALLLGFLGGVLGCLIVLPLHGVDTGTTNFQTFSEVAFAFRVTPAVLVASVVFAALLGVAGGVIPAWTAAQKLPTDALHGR